MGSNFYLEFFKIVFPGRKFLKFQFDLIFLSARFFLKIDFPIKSRKCSVMNFSSYHFFVSGRNKIEPNKKFRNVFRIPVVPVKALQVLPLKCLLRTFEARALLVTLMTMQDWLVLMLCLRTY